MDGRGEINPTAWESGAAARRLKSREGSGDGAVTVVVFVESRRFELKRDSLELRMERAVMARVRVLAIVFSDEDLWEIEEEDDRRKKRGFLK